MSSAQIYLLTVIQRWSRLKLEPAVVGELAQADTYELVTSVTAIPARATGILDWDCLLLLFVRGLAAFSTRDQCPYDVDDEEDDPYLSCAVQEAWDSLELGSSSGGEVFAEVAGTE